MNATVTRDDQSITVMVDNQILFSDSVAHWNDAFCRLLSLDEELLLQFVEQACLEWARSGSTDAVTSLSTTWHKLGRDAERQVSDVRSIEWCGKLYDDIQFRTMRIRESTDYGLVVSPSAQHGWLIDLASGLRSTSSNVEYENAYFEGSDGSVGYGSYFSQSGWRIEKAQRQLREIEGLFAYLVRRQNSQQLKLLDVGSGYGYFQIAAESAGWSTAGIELSKHASTVAQQQVKGDVFCGTLEDFESNCEDRFDAVVMWDFIEHVDNPTKALAIAERFLAHDGLLFIRTPNLMATEFEVFGGDYHSLKLEHLHLFSPSSACDVLRTAGLRAEVILSTSHLLDGFQFFDSKKMATTLRGSDLLICASKA